MPFGPHLQVVIIVQARMGASRLPGKPLKKVLGRPLLSYLLERLKQVSHADEIVVATTLLKQDDPIARLAKREGVLVSRGSEEDVLSRYLVAAEASRADVIVRITADCPLVDPRLIDAMLKEFKQGTYDYFSNTVQRTFPRGMDVEIFTKESLKKAALSAATAPEREHVTLFMYRHPELFRIGNYAAKKDDSRHRWTVDTEEDFALIRKILLKQYREKAQFSLDDLISLLNRHPEWERLNAHIEQKKVP